MNEVSLKFKKMSMVDGKGLDIGLRSKVGPLGFPPKQIISIV
jgi:hypothetical protein